MNTLTMVYKTMAWLGVVSTVVIGLGVNAAPMAHAADFCTEPQSISFPHGVHATTGGVSLGSISLVDGDVQSNENVVAGALAEVTGNVNAVGTIDPGLLTNIGGTATEGAASLPFPSLSLPGWEGVATAGGVIAGDVSVPVNGSMNLGPNQIDGNLTLEANSELILDGPLYITGDLVLEENSLMHLGSGFTSGGTLVVVEGTATIDGNADINGLGSSAPILLVSKSSGTAIDVGGNFATNSVVFFAGSGTVLVGDNAEIIAAYGERVEVGANAEVLHAAGLVDAVFECPPTDDPVDLDLSLAKTVDDNTPDAGQTITYTVTVTNSAGSSANDVVVTDVLPTGVTYVSHDTNGTGTYDQTTGVWTIGTVAASGTATLEITTTVSAASGQTVNNTASVDTSSVDSNPDNDSASAAFTVNQSSGGGNSDGGSGSSSSSGSRRSGSRSNQDNSSTSVETPPIPQVLGAVTPTALPRTGAAPSMLLMVLAVGAFQFGYRLKK